MHPALEFADLFDRNVIKESVRHCIYGDHLLVDRHRFVLALLENLNGAGAALELPLRGGIEIRRKRRKRFELAVLREVEAQSAGDLLHRLDLRRAADSRDGDADVDGGPLASEEQVGLEKDLAVSDRNDVRRNVGRDVTGLRFYDRQSRQRTARLQDVFPVHDRRVFAQLCRALEQA